MPARAKHPCGHQGCRELVNTTYCVTHTPVKPVKVKTVYEQHRGSAHQRGYTARWRAYRVGFLSMHPLCAECESKGIIKVATVVDHIIAHKGDKVLFWDYNNHQALCKRCHDKKTVREDGGGWKHGK